MRVLLTGATGKIGQEFLRRFLASDQFADWEIAALCHNRRLPPTDRVTSVIGSLANAEDVALAIAGATHVVHMAAVKESPDLAIDVAVKGMFLLLEAARTSGTVRQFILIGGDCSVGHIFHGYDGPITESSPRRAYPGCYALTKVIEEVMLEQYQIQYGLNGCCLRAPWVMEKDDFRHVLRFDETQFGGPAWTGLLPEAEIARCAAEGVVPLMLDAGGAPLRRNFVHVSDLARAVLAALDAPAARQQLFNVAMDVPVSYAAVTRYLSETRGLGCIEIPTPFHGNWLSNAKARRMLDWAPEYDLASMIEAAWSYDRPVSDPRVVIYPG